MWASISAGGLIVLGGLGFGGYEWYQNHQYSYYFNQGQTALQIHDYKDAETNFLSALKYRQNLVVQADASFAKELVASQTFFKKGQQAMSAGQYNSAVSDFKSVSSKDTVDYPEAQKLLKGAETDLALGQIIQDVTDYLNADSVTESDVNNLVDPSNSLPNDVMGSSAFNNDLSLLQGGLSILDKDISHLQTWSSTISTAGATIPSTQVENIVSNLESAIQQDISDMNTMSNSISDTVSSAQYDQKQYNLGQYGYYAIRSQSSVDAWNKAIQDTSNLDSTIQNDLAKLKAFAPSSTNLSPNQQTSAPPSVSTAPQSASTTSQTDSAMIQSDIEQIKNNGYIPVSTQPGAQTPDGFGHMLYAWDAIAKGSADGQSQLVFFFINSKYLGTDTAQPHPGIYKLTAIGTGSITVGYDVWKKGNSMADPTGTPFYITYTWNGHSLTPNAQYQNQL